MRRFAPEALEPWIEVDGGAQIRGAAIVSVVLSSRGCGQGGCNRTLGLTDMKGGRDELMRPLLGSLCGLGGPTSGRRASGLLLIGNRRSQISCSLPKLDSRRLVGGVLPPWRGDSTPMVSAVC
jgi:hypothetical protein